MILFEASLHPQSTEEKVEKVEEKMEEEEEKVEKEKEEKIEKEEEKMKKEKEEKEKEKDENMIMLMTLNEDIAKLQEEKRSLEERCGQYQQELQKKTDDVKDLTKQITSLIPHSTTLQQELDRMKELQASLSHDHTALQDTLTTTEQKLETQVAACAQLEENLATMQKEEGELRKQIQRLEEERSVIVSTSRMAEAKVEELEKEGEQMKQVIKESLEGLEMMQEQMQQVQRQAIQAMEGGQEKDRRIQQLIDEREQERGRRTDEINQLQSQLETMQKEKEQLVAAVTEKETSIQTLTESLQSAIIERDARATALESATASLQERGTIIATLSSQLQEQEAKLQALDAKSKLLENKSKGETRQLRQTIVNLGVEKEALLARLERAQNESKSSEQFVQQLHLEIASLQHVITSTEEELERMDYNQVLDWDDLDNVRKQVINLRKEKEEAEAEVQHLRMMMEGLRGSYADGYREADALQRELNNCEGLLDIARDSYAKSTARISELENDIKFCVEQAGAEQVILESRIGQLQQEVETLKNELITEKEQRETLEAKCAELQEKLHTTEGELGLMLQKDECDLSSISAIGNSTLSPSPHTSRIVDAEQHSKMEEEEKEEENGGGREGEKMENAQATTQATTQNLNSSPSSSAIQKTQVIPPQELEQAALAASNAVKEAESLRAELKESEEKFLRLQQTMKAKYGEYKAMCERVQDLERQEEEHQKYHDQLEEFNKRLNDSLTVMTDKYKAAKVEISSLKEQVIPKDQIKAMKHVIQTKRKLEENNKRLTERELVLKEELLHEKRARQEAEQSAHSARQSLQEQELRLQESEQELAASRESLKEERIRNEQLERDLQEAQNSTMTSTYGSSRSYLESENLKLTVRVDELKQEIDRLTKQLKQQEEAGRNGRNGRAGQSGQRTDQHVGENDGKGEGDGNRRWSVLRPYHPQGGTNVKESPAKTRKMSEFNADASTCNPQ